MAVQAPPWSMLWGSPTTHHTHPLPGLRVTAVAPHLWSCVLLYSIPPQEKASALRLLVYMTVPMNRWLTLYVCSSPTIVPSPCNPKSVPITRPGSNNDCSATTSSRSTSTCTTTKAQMSKRDEVYLHVLRAWDLTEGFGCLQSLCVARLEHPGQAYKSRHPWHYGSTVLYSLCFSEPRGG